MHPVGANAPSPCDPPRLVSVPSQQADRAEATVEDDGGVVVGALAGFITRYVSEQKALGRFTGTGPQSTRSQLASLNKWHGDRSLCRLTRDSIIKWLGSMEHLAPNTRRSYLAAAAGFCRWMVRKGHLAQDPTLDVPRPKIPRSTPRALAHDAVAACLRACTDDRERAIIWLGVGLGMRRAEIANARWADYDDLAGTIRVTGKGGHVRVLPVIPEVRAALEKIRGPRSYPIIGRQSGVEGKPLTVRQISYLVRNIVERAGVKHSAHDGVGVHSLRHTAASDVLEVSGDLRAVQTMLGHANLSTTSVYLRSTSMASLREAMAGREYHQMPEAA